MIPLTPVIVTTLRPRRTAARADAVDPNGDDLTIAFVVRKPLSHYWLGPWTVRKQMFSSSKSVRQRPN